MGMFSKPDSRASEAEAPGERRPASALVQDTGTGEWFRVRPILLPGDFEDAT